MNPQIPSGLNEPNVRHDLQAAVGARRELDAEMEDHVLEAFLARVDQRIAERVDQQIAQSSVAAKPAKQSKGRSTSDAWIVPASLGVCIPLIAIAGAAAGMWGVLGVCAAVFLILATYWGTHSD